MILQISFLDASFNIYDTRYTSKNTLNMDYLSNGESKFTLGKGDYSLGDYIFIKIKGSEKIIYFGYIDSIDDSGNTDSIVSTRYIYDLFDGSIIIISTSGNSYESHLKNLLVMYSSQASIPLISSSNIGIPTSTPFSVAVTNPPNTGNLKDYIIRGLKLHGVSVQVIDLQNTGVSGIPSYKPVIQISRVAPITTSWKITDKDSSYLNWSVQDSTSNTGYVNCLKIVDKASKNMESPKVLATYYLQKNGQITQTLGSAVLQPCRVSVYLYDTTQSDKPTYQSVASAQLTGNNYSHIIQMDASINSDSDVLSYLTIGNTCDVTYKNKVYNTMLTGFQIDSSNDAITLIFGNIRNTLKDIIGG